MAGTRVSWSPHSLIKKLLKGKHSYESVPDKVGVRCIVRYLSDVDVAVSTAAKLFNCSQADLEVIALLIPLYSTDAATVKHALDSFLHEHQNVLHAVHAEADDFGASAFLYQPEVLMIYERLDGDQLAIHKTWNTRFPESELERVANTFGISFH